MGSSVHISFLARYSIINKKKGINCMKRMAVYLMILLGVTVSLLIDGCMSKRTPTTDQPRLSETAAKKIGVMPFLKGKHYANIDDPTDRTLNCSLDQLCFNADNLESKADEILTRLMWNALAKKFNERLISLDEAIDAYNEITIERKNDTPRSLAVKLGKKLGAEHMILGVVWRYRDRDGTAMAVNSPASVAFAVYLLDVESRERKWKKVFDQTQRSLSENILHARDFFKHGAKWLSASELARLGVGKIEKTIPLK